MNRSTLIIAIVALLCGCASVNTVRTADVSKGEERIFNADYEHTAAAVTETLNVLGLENIEVYDESATTTVFLGSVGITPASWGEVVRVIVTGIDADTSSVRIYWRHKFRDGLISFAPQWDKRIFEHLNERVSARPNLTALR